MVLSAPGKNARALEYQNLPGKLAPIAFAIVVDVGKFPDLPR